MNKKYIWLKKFFVSIVIITSYSFIFLKIKELGINKFNLPHFSAIDIFLLFVLMIFNWSLEAIKLKILVKNYEKINFTTACKSVLFSLPAGIITPNRLGEIPAKAFFLKPENRKKAIVNVSIGSILQAMTTAGGGILGFLLLIKNLNWLQNYWLALSITFLIIMILAIIFAKKILNTKFFRNKFFNGVNTQFYDFKTVTKAFSVAVLRYIVFVFQFAMILKLYNVNPTINIIAGISLSFMLINLLPHFVIADLGIRSSITLLILTPFTNNQAALLISPALLWLINIAFPSILGTYIWIKQKRKQN